MVFVLPPTCILDALITDEEIVKFVPCILDSVAELDKNKLFGPTFTPLTNKLPDRFKHPLKSIQSLGSVGLKLIAPLSTSIGERLIFGPETFGVPTLTSELTMLTTPPPMPSSASI